MQHTRPPCPSPTHRDYSNSSTLSQWCHPTIISSLVPFSCLQSFPASGSFPMSQVLISGGRSIRVSISISVLWMNTQDWSPLGWTGWISLQSKGLSRVFSNTTVQMYHRIVNTKIRLIILFAGKDGAAMYNQQKQDWELTVSQIMNFLLPNSFLNWSREIH